jgi:hypothetical protein
VRWTLKWRRNAKTVIRNMEEDSVSDEDSGSEQQQQHQDHAASSWDAQERAASAWH